MLYKKFLGIELGSTRIKSILIDESGDIIARGCYEWENKLEDGYWTYSLSEVWRGIQASYAALAAEYEDRTRERLNRLDGIGISAMMHGYLAFNKEGELLVPFRTWRNTTTSQAAESLTKILGFNIPQRWSVAHYYQAVLNNEPHVKDVAYLTTLAGYVHWRLTGEKVLGIGDASGMFPISGGGYDNQMLAKFNVQLKEKGIDTPFESLLPKVMTAGECAGYLTAEGSKLLDQSGTLTNAPSFCPPEGDAGTGMVATNALQERTGNVSAGTSAFVMVVMEKSLKNVYSEIDVVTTPSGKPVAMVHVNNFTSEINVWTKLFGEVAELAGGCKDNLIGKLFLKSADSDENCGGLVGYNFLSGEPIADCAEGRPLLLRPPKGNLTLANFMQMQIYSALGTLALGMDILAAENVEVKEICGHGGFFRTELIGAKAMSAAVNAPVTVMKNSGEGGAWGIALLALYVNYKNETLERFISALFENIEKTAITADGKERAKFAAFMEKYKKGLAVEQFAAEVL